MALVINHSDAWPPSLRGRAIRICIFEHVYVVSVHRKAGGRPRSLALQYGLNSPCWADFDHGMTTGRSSKNRFVRKNRYSSEKGKLVVGSMISEIHVTPCYNDRMFDDFGSSVDPNPDYSGPSSRINSFVGTDSQRGNSVIPGFEDPFKLL